MSGWRPHINLNEWQISKLCQRADTSFANMGPKGACQRTRKSQVDACKRTNLELGRRIVYMMIKTMIAVITSDGLILGQ